MVKISIILFVAMVVALVILSLAVIALLKNKKKQTSEFTNLEEEENFRNPDMEALKVRAILEFIVVNGEETFITKLQNINSELVNKMMDKNLTSSDTLTINVNKEVVYDLQKIKESLKVDAVKPRLQ